MLQGFAPPGEPSRGRLLGRSGAARVLGDTSSVKPTACHLPLKGKAFGAVWGGSGARGGGHLILRTEPVLRPVPVLRMAYSP